MHAAFSESSLDEMMDRYQGMSCSNFKMELAETLVESLDPIANRINELRSQPAYLEEVLAMGMENPVCLERVHRITGSSRCLGKEKANVKAGDTMSRVKRTLGIYR